jgi:hypothetical protein
MHSPHINEPALRRRSARNRAHYGPVLWIVLLLAAWFVIAEWRMLPEVISKAMAALP